MKTVTKDLVKCKHPNSRKTSQVAKQIKKTKLKEKAKQNNTFKQNLIGEKILWFKENLGPVKTLCTPRDVLEIIEKYLSRFNEELEQIKLKHSVGNRKNRQHASRQDIINMTVQRENEEFNTCGLEIPDLLNPIQFTLLKEWDGRLQLLPKFKLKRYAKGHLQKLVSDTKSDLVVMEVS